MQNKRNVQKSRQNKKRRPQQSTGMKGLTMTKSIFPASFKGVLTFTQVIAMTAAAGVSSANVYRLNSVYDPDFTGVGQTVYGYSALSGLYNRYKVMGGRATVQFVNLNTTPDTLFIVVNPNNSVGVDIQKILGQRYVWSTGLANTSSAPAVLSHSIAWRTAKVYGVSEKAVSADDDFAGLVGGSPNNAIYMHVGAYANGSSAASYNIHVRIEFDVEWSLPLQISL